MAWCVAAYLPQLYLFLDINHQLPLIKELKKCSKAETA